ncbi:hypothetical protein PZ739_03355 [Pseudomonas kermanshahensis]|jgi:energy-coupling factor transporter transmembrane protein EcfT|uniref:hypothetical protein n=1 Tax=Pseudomonas TaxID=286 RepID=UPI0004802337|nr:MULTISPECIES: hypothetical protein [Pseudomonas]ATP43175.1 hypothetical protein CR511_03610 [Pseudomonas putida]WEL56212.1 hypothetical protein PZ739_03355 [Pseudomonas kermanshahensis]
MTDTSDDLSLGEAENTGLVSDYLRRESWRFRWEKRLTTVTVALVIIFYLALLGFVFLGNIRISAGAWYFFTSVKPHSTGDIPIIVALSTVPTLLLIALLRYFHHRPKPEQDDSQAPLPISVEAAKEIIKATTDAMKAP